MKILVTVETMQVKFNKYWEVCSLCLGYSFCFRSKVQAEGRVIQAYPRLCQDQVEADLKFEKVRTSVYDLLNEHTSRNRVEATPNMNIQISSLYTFASQDSYGASTMSVE